MLDRRLFAVLVVLCALVAPGMPSLAQEAEPEPETETEATAEETPAVPAELASARATLRTFLEAFTLESQRLESAARCLDLSELRPDVRPYKGKELAWQLKQVIDRTQFIVFDEIPDDAEGEPYVLSIGEAGEVVVAPDDDGVWRFTADTVAVIADLEEATRGTEVVEGVVRAEPMTPAMWLRSKMPPALSATGFLLENWQWLGLVLLALLGWVLDRLLTTVVQTTIERYLAQRMESVDKKDLRYALRPLGLFAASLLWWSGIFWLGLPVWLLEVLVVVVKFVAATAFVWALYRLVDVAATVLQVRASHSEGTFDDLLVPLIRKSAKVLVIAFGLVFIADTLNLPLTSVIAGIGIGGLALALAAQDAVKNLFGSFVVILDRPFSVGDFVQVGGISGTVVELGFRSTRIKASDGTAVVVPNGSLISATVENLSGRPSRRWRTMLSLTYDTPPEKIEAFCEGVRELIRQHPDTQKDSFKVYLNEMSASSLDVLMHMFFDTTDWETELRGRHRMSLDILRLAADLDVELAFPTQSVYVHATGDSDPSGSTNTSALSETASLDDVLEDARHRARGIAEA